MRKFSFRQNADLGGIMIFTYFLCFFRNNGRGSCPRPSVVVVYLLNNLAPELSSLSEQEANHLPHQIRTAANIHAYILFTIVLI